MSDEYPTLPGFKPIGQLVPKVKRPSPIKSRLVKASVEIQEAPNVESILFQHSVLCQTCLPYRDPGDHVRTWTRRNGFIALRIKAGEVPEKKEGQPVDFVDVGLPFGPKPRLVFYHLNAEALRTGSRKIEVEDSLTAFVKRIGLDTHGRNMRVMKEQLIRLSAADFKLGSVIEQAEGTSSRVDNPRIISGFEVWTPRDPKQRVLWPTTVEFSREYFEDLQKHAVPLNEEAIAALKFSAMSLDLYTWLAQRLHRIPAGGKGQFIPWTALHDQFGQNYSRIRKFREVFLVALGHVHLVYKDANFNTDHRGMTLWHSKPPVERRMVLISSNAKN